ncbi:hypothetical protein [Legionella sp. W05-934-2]|jgi:hypothetical protein|uniref:hypothetical protein n=1 Tax=Legionella sp. W05-934-2 TaxID=1198649 RepID=UPI003462DB7B
MNRLLLTCSLLACLMMPNMAFSKDGYCKCYFNVQKTELEQVTANSRRPVICESCQSRCELLIDRVKKEQSTDKVTLDKSECS